MMHALVVASLVAASTSTSLQALRAELPRGRSGALVNYRCEGSGSDLGTSDLGVQSANGSDGYASTVVNIWAIHETGNVKPTGWIVKTGNGKLWYERVDARMPDALITESLASRLIASGKTFAGCFTHDYHY